jgi:hypothetical protein
MELRPKAALGLPLITSLRQIEGQRPRLEQFQE